MSSLSPPSQQLSSGGSATGNPRNKCALKPGHSLMDWIRLGNSGVDLTGFKGRTISVSAEELAKHSTRDDAWLCIRGKVYNVTRYMDFHPGGVDELMRGVGRDATKLFDEVHAWVNYQQLLAKCYIGPLKNVVKVDQNLLLALTSKTKSNPIKALAPSEIVPRFDWTQKRNILTIYFYTRQDCNPGLIVHRKNSKESQIIIQIEHAAHKFQFEFQNHIEWPLNAVNINSSIGKVILAFNKAEENLWYTYGSHTSQKIATWNAGTEGIGDGDEFEYKFEIVSSEKFNHDSFELCLKGSDVVIVPPVGFHVTIGAVVNGKLILRSYTPISARFCSRNDSSQLDCCLKFLIKSYGKNGLLSSYLEQLPVGCTVQICIPKGNFKFGALQQCRRLVLLAAGSGLTPCLSLIDYFKNSTTTKIEQLLLVYFNKTEADIWCRAQLNEIAQNNEKIRFVNVLSQPSSDWSGLKGHISTELFAGLFDKSIPQNETFITVCGPTIFNDLTEKCLKELEYNSGNIHIFRG